GIAKELRDEQRRRPGKDGEHPPLREGCRDRNRKRNGEKQPAFARDDRVWVALAHYLDWVWASMRLPISSVCCCKLLSSSRARSRGLVSPGVVVVGSALIGVVGPTPRGPAVVAAARSLGRRPYCLSSVCASIPTMTSASSITISPTQPRWRPMVRPSRRA